jgi:multicomponent Na+:H+ antiporter subunit F
MHSNFPELPVLVTAGVPLVLLMSLILTVWRALLGPSTADRVMALDLVGAMLMGACVWLAIVSGRELFLDVALAVAVIAFIGTIAFSRQIEDEKQHRSK